LQRITDCLFHVEHEKLLNVAESENFFDNGKTLKVEIVWIIKLQNAIEKYGN
jgi:hypothetical protein